MRQEKLVHHGGTEHMEKKKSESLSVLRLRGENAVVLRFDL
jgi:hypothetical protein